RKGRATMRHFYVWLSIGLLLIIGCGSKMAKRAVRAPNADADEAAQGGLVDAGKPAAPVPRKIIYTARVELIVEGLDKAEQEIPRLIQEQHAYVAKSEIEGSPGSPRSGTWTVRVPANRFPAFMDAVGKLGELRR